MRLGNRILVGLLLSAVLVSTPSFAYGPPAAVAPSQPSADGHAPNLEFGVLEPNGVVVFGVNTRHLLPSEYGVGFGVCLVGARVVWIVAGAYGGIGVNCPG